MPPLLCAHQQKGTDACRGKAPTRRWLPGTRAHGFPGSRRPLLCAAGSLLVL